MAKKKGRRRKLDKPVGGVHGTAAMRRHVVIESLDRELDLHNSFSTASLFQKLASDATAPQQVVTSGDVDGLVSSAMLCSVLPDWKVVAVIVDSQQIWVNPSLLTRPDNLFGVDVFSLAFHNISNHIQYYGPKSLRRPAKLKAFKDWDNAVSVEKSKNSRIFANPNIWAGINACYEDANRPLSAKYKYPLGTAQLLLALLEVISLPPKFYDRRYLPWLVANCDGGISTFANHGYNADIWWPTLAAAVGPGSLTEALYSRVAHMRPQDFRFEVNSLAREFHSTKTDLFLDDKWRLKGVFPGVFIRALDWLLDLTGWHDPILGGREALNTWHRVSTVRTEKISLNKIESTEIAEAHAIDDARRAALNANFYIGGKGKEGSRFNWVGGW